MRKGLFLFPLLFTFSCATMGDNQELNALKAEIQVLKLKSSKMEKEINSLKGENLSLKRELPELKITLAKLQELLSQEEGKVSFLEREIEKVKMESSRTTTLKVREVRSELSKDLSSIKGEITSLKSCCGEKGKELSNLEERLQTLEKEVETLKERLNSLKIPSVKIEKVKPSR